MEDNSLRINTGMSDSSCTYEAENHKTKQESSLPINGSNQRKRRQNATEDNPKRTCDEGYSWWTSMMLGIAPKQQQSFSRVNILANEREESLQPALTLPLKPQEPLPSDCCGSGCTPCVFDIYEQDLRKWEQKCKDIASGTASYLSSSCAIISRSEFKEFEVESRKKVAENCWVYRFTIPGGKSLGLKVGEHLILRSDMEDPPITRQYTPISPLGACGYFDVLIKIYEDGKMSQYVKTWQVGDRIKWKGPFGRFMYVPNRYHHICMLAAGTGIAPMIQVLQTILDNDDDNTRISLFYACHTYQDILMKDVLDASTDHWNFNVTYAISRVDPPQNKTCVRYGDRVHYARIDKDLLSRELPAPSDKVFVLICGTKSFDKDMINYLSQLGYSESMYFRF